MGTAKNKYSLSAQNSGQVGKKWLHNSSYKQVVKEGHWPALSLFSIDKLEQYSLMLIKTSQQHTKIPFFPLLYFQQIFLRTTSKLSPNTQWPGSCSSSAWSTQPWAIFRPKREQVSLLYQTTTLCHFDTSTSCNSPQVYKVFFPSSSSLLYPTTNFRIDDYWWAMALQEWLTIQVLSLGLHCPGKELHLPTYLSHQKYALGWSLSKQIGTHW